MKYALFSGVDEAAIKGLISNGTRAFYKPKDLIFSQGDEGHNLYLLEDGHIAVKMDLATGDSLSMQVLGPGAFFGEVAVVSDPPIRHITTRAVDQVTVIKIHRDAFSEFRLRNPVVNQTLLNSLGSTIRLLYLQLAELSSENVEIRLLRRLLDVAELFGRGPASAGTIVPLTQQDVADLVGTSRPTASSMLQDAQRNGLIKLERGKITIVDPARLETRSRRKH